jgi:hypothetical protein
MQESKRPIQLKYQRISDVLMVRNAIFKKNNARA